MAKFSIAEIRAQRAAFSDAYVYLHNSRENYFDRRLVVLAQRLRERPEEDREELLREMAAKMKGDGYWGRSLGPKTIALSMLRRMYYLEMDEKDRHIEWADFVNDLLGPDFLPKSRSES